MEFWISGETQGDIDDGAFRNAIIELTDTLNSGIKTHNYGDLIEWILIPIILDDQFSQVTGFNEVKKFWRNKKETEFRLKIDHAAFKAADDLGKRKLIFAMIMRSIDLARKMNIPNFDFDRFESDVRGAGKNHRWL